MWFMCVAHVTFLLKRLWQQGLVSCTAWQTMAGTGKWKENRVIVARGQRRGWGNIRGARSCQIVLSKPGKFNKVHPSLHVHSCFPCLFVWSSSNQWFILKAFLEHPLWAGKGATAWFSCSWNEFLYLWEKYVKTERKPGLELDQSVEFLGFIFTCSAISIKLHQLSGNVPNP